MNMNSQPLSGFTVIEIGGGAAAAYCGRLLADAGARVIATAIHEDSRFAGILRSTGETESAYAAFLASGKESVSADADTIATLCRDADIVLIGEDAGIDAAPAQPRQATIAMSWFGRRGECSGWRGSDLVIQVLTGLPQMAGSTSGEPQAAGDRQATTVAGVTAYIAACAACIAALRRGKQSTHTLLDISVLDANLVLAEMHLHLYERDQTPMQRLGINRFIPTAPCGIYPCKSGWVGITAATPDQWRSLCKALKLILPTGAEELATRELRMERLDEVESSLSAALQARTADEWAAIGREFRIPMVAVPDAQGILDHPIFRARNSLHALELERRTVRVPRSPLGLPERSNDAAQALPTRAPIAASGLGSAGLLSGMKLLDFSMGWAGPLASRCLADFGAEVWKIEAARYPDWWRGVNWTPDFIESKQYEQSQIFTALNRGKLGVSIDLTTPVGLELALALVDKADAVIENQAAGVMAKFGLDWPDLRSRRPDLVMASMSAFGAGNAWSHTRAYGSTLEQGSGLPSLVGAPGAAPTMTHVAHGDAVGGLYGCAALLTALVHRQRTGAGRYVNVSMVESMLQLTTAGLLEYQLTGHTERRGNQHPAMAPQGIYSAAGSDQWVAVSVSSATEFASLASLIGRPDLASDESLSEASTRRARHEDIDIAIRLWTSSLSASDAARQLQAIGVAAAPVLNIAALPENKHLQAEGVYIDIDRAQSGRQRQIGAPIVQDGRRLGAKSPAPLLGEHTFAVLSQYADVSPARFDDLLRTEVVSFAPKPSRNLLVT